MPDSLEPNHVHYATLDRIIDGDTGVFMVDLDFKVSVAITVRVRGVDAPELHGLSASAGAAAKQYSYDLLRGKRVTLLSYHDQMSFARWVCDVYVDGDSWADRLVRAAHAV